MKTHRQKLLAEGPYTMSTVNGWVNMTNLGRYGTDYNTRAFIAYAGLGALTSDDAVYPSAFIDGDGHALDAAYNYVIHFPKGQLPPSGSNVWSISSGELLHPKRAEPLWHPLLNAAQIQR